MEAQLNFRAAGMTDAAINYPLSAEAKAILAEHNHVPASQLPPEAGYAPNVAMRDWLEWLAARRAVGLPTRNAAGDAWLTRA